MSSREIEDLRWAVQEGDRLVSAAQAKRRDAAQALAEATCPHKVGDVLDVPDATYVHRGKKCIVTAIRPGRFGSYDYLVLAYLIKKDGTQSLVSATWDGKYQ